MDAESEVPDDGGGLVTLGLLSMTVGAASGLLGAAFRLALERADHWRGALLAWGHGLGEYGWLAVAGVCAAATAAAAWMVRRFFPHASGSGIPHVECVLRGELPPAPFRLLPVKFVGGTLAIGSGLALGREGPSVQMGAGVAHLIGHVFRRSAADCRVLLAAGAGAGLATAFNAPVAGAAFVLEELMRRFDTRTTVATFGASAAAIAVSRAVLGHAPDFRVEVQPYQDFPTIPVFLALGVVAGLLGVAYNRTILGTLTAAGRLRMPVELRAGLIGAAVGAIAWSMPDLVGGGDPITQRTLTGTETATGVALVFAARFALGAVSYAAGTPGGLFAPLLVLGCQSGVLFGSAWARWLPAAPAPAALGVVGMAAFFTAVVRAPVTGIALVTEMTGSFTLLLPMLSACFTAMLVPTLLGDPPVYDSLRERTLQIDEGTVTRGQ